MVKASAPVASAAAARVAGRVVTNVPQIGWSVVELPGDLNKARQTMLGVAGVKRVEFDRAARLAYTPNDPLWQQQWHFRTLKVERAWDVSRGTTPVTVAVIDTGILETHPDLANNLWTNPGEIPNNGIDDDGNGKIDDVHGWNFVNDTKNLADNYGHGTPCSGIVAATQDNNLGVSGVAPLGRVMMIKATNEDGYLFDSYLIPSYIYAADNGARVFSMSYWSDRVSAAEKDAMDYAVSRGVLPVAAAGNEASAVPQYPAGYENVVSVAAVNQSVNKSGFSNFGTWVDVSAPGEDLTTTHNDGGYGWFGGTSGACPHVAGLATLLFSANPNATARQVREAIEDTATTLNQAPFGEYANYGLVDAEAAMRAILGAPAPPKSVRVRYITNFGISLSTSSILPARYSIARIYGRGFNGVANLRVTQGAVEAFLVNRDRDWVDYRHDVKVNAPVQVWDGQTLLATVQPPVVPRLAFPAIEFSTPGGSATGDFFSTLNDDAQVLTATTNGANLDLQVVFRKVPANSGMQLRVRRRYTGASGNESVRLYDWSSNSYPYGSWDTVSTVPVPTTDTTTLVSVPDIAKYIDPEGSVYARIVVPNQPGNARLLVDSLRLQLRR
ncbi:MAG: S8 family serine peptidase [Fimbriimonadaceae bacterium]|nr:MAG: S8 family serine peptidase [Fimbriimonadaceae bacterium]